MAFPQPRPLEVDQLAGLPMAFYTAVLRAFPEFEHLSPAHWFAFLAEPLFYPSQIRNFGTRI
jgi:hypothetical protein